MFLQGLMSAVELRYARLFTALSRYCPIPVVVEPQPIYMFRSEPFVAAQFYFLEMAVIAERLSAIMAWRLSTCL